MKIKLIQAPMAGGPSSQELVAACSAAGALGSFSFAYTQPDEMRKQSERPAQRARAGTRAYAPDLEAETVEAIRTLKGLEHAS